MIICQRKKGREAKREWCVTHHRSIWACVKVFQRRAQLLEEQVTLLRKLKVVENELKLLMTSCPN